MGGSKLSENPIVASDKARVNAEKCTGCGLCVEACPYGAIRLEDGVARVAEIMCEGCGTCALACPLGAITIEQTLTGYLDVEVTRYGFRVVTGRLRAGEHNSGKLVTAVKTIGKREAEAVGAEVVIVDAAPGIGCPVIASISGASYVVAVVEPTPTSLRNVGRLVAVAEHFNVPVGFVINKASYPRNIPRGSRNGCFPILKLNYWLKYPSTTTRLRP